MRRKLKARAATAGMSLSDYLLNDLRRLAEQPTDEEIRERIARRSPVTPKETPEAAVRAERDSR